VPPPAASAEPAAASEGSGAAGAESAEGADGAAAGAAPQTAAVESAPAAEAGAGAAAGGEGVGPLLAHADLDAGAKDARKCAACHSFEEGGAAKIGPPLWNVVGRDIASVQGFAYSSALQGKDGAWDYQTLDAFLTQPRQWAPGTKMAFAGIKKPEERADVILYLRSLATAPAPLP
jgi:cytochrome c